MMDCQIPIRQMSSVFCAPQSQEVAGLSLVNWDQLKSLIGSLKTTSVVLKFNYFLKTCENARHPQ